MINKKRASTGVTSRRGPTLRAAIHCALIDRRSALRVSASLIAFGLSTQPVLAAPFPAELELSSLQMANGGDGSTGFVLNGIDLNDRSGISVSTAGDVNGDGTDDLIVGAFYAEPDGRLKAGESYVVFGRDQAAFPAEIELSSLLPANGGDGSEGFVLNGIDAYDRSGRQVSAVGDVNSDGFDDLLVGAYVADPGGRGTAGRSYLVFGRDQTTGGFPAELELSSLLPANGGDGSEGFVLNGIDAGDQSGFSVSAAGDVNGDSVDDLLVGARNASAGQSYVVFGRDETTFPAELELSSLQSTNGGDGSAGFVLNGIDVGDRSGTSVSAAGDVNGDGIDDLLIGAVEADPDGRRSAGESYVVFGRDQTGFPAEFELSSLLSANGTEGFILNGIDSRDGSGISVSGAGDVNGDGVDDLLVGAHRAGLIGEYDIGESYVVFGRNQTGFPAVLELSSLLPANGGNGTIGFVLIGIDVSDYSGHSVSAAGDLNGDSVDDFLIGAFLADPGDRQYAGESYVVFGRDQTAFPAEFELSSLQTANGGNGSAGFVLNGINAGDQSGISVSAAGDVNGDGIDDLLVGADRADPGGREYSGQSYVVFGRPRDGAAVLCDGAEATITGTEGRDFIVGTPGPDVIQALDGNDTIQGMGGIDLICGGEGNDFIYGNGGNDRMFGDAGNDRLIGGGGRDFMHGGLGNDEVFGRGGVDRLFGNEGDDLLFGQGGTDHLHGGAAFDRCDGGGSTFDTAAGCEQISKVP